MNNDRCCDCKAKPIKICLKNYFLKLLETLDFIKYDTKPYNGKTYESNLCSKFFSLAIQGFLLYVLIMMVQDFKSTTISTMENVEENLNKSNDLSTTKTPIMIYLKGETQNISLLTIKASLVLVKTKNGIPIEYPTPIQLIPCSQSIVNEHPQKYKKYLASLKQGWYCLPANQIYKLYDNKMKSEYQYLSIDVVACDNSSTRCADENYLNNYILENKYFQLSFSYREVIYNLKNLTDYELDTINSQNHYKFYPSMTFEDEYFLETVQIDEYEHPINPFDYSITSSIEASNIITQDGVNYPQTGTEYLKIAIRPTSKFKKMSRQYPNIISLLEHVISVTMAFLIIVKVIRLYCQLCHKIRIYKDRFRSQEPRSAQPGPDKSPNANLSSVQLIGQQSDRNAQNQQQHESTSMNDIDWCWYFNFFYFIAYFFYDLCCPNEYVSPESRRQILLDNRNSCNLICRLTAQIKESESYCDMKKIYDRIQNLNSFFFCFMVYLEQIATKAQATVNRSNPTRTQRQAQKQKNEQKPYMTPTKIQIKSKMMEEEELENPPRQRIEEPKDNLEWWQKNQYMSDNLEIVSLMLLRARLKNLCFPYRKKSLSNFFAFYYQKQITPDVIKDINNSIRANNKSAIPQNVSDFFIPPVPPANSRN